MKKHYIIILLFVLILFSCNQNNKNDTIILKHEEIKIEDMIIGYARSIKNIDSFLIVLDYKNEALFHLVNINKMQYKGIFGIKGEGPKDFIHPVGLTQYAVHSLCCYDLMNRKISEISIHNDSISSKTIMKCDTLTNFNIIPGNNNSYIGVGSYQDSMFKIINKEGQIIKGYFSYPSKDKDEAKIPENIRAMAYQGQIDINPSRNKFAYATSYAKQLYFFSIKENRIQTIKEIKESYPQYIPDTSQGTSAVFDRKAPFGFTDIITDKYIYALYSGKSFEKHRLKCSEGNNLLIYNWEGDLVKEYEFDISVLCFCVNEKNNIIYAIANNPNPTIVVFKI